VPSLSYHHVDVFAKRPFAGNSLAVFAGAAGLNAVQMLIITQELRHFESIFLEPAGLTNTYRARIFDLIEELEFAGHPLLGAAAALHELKRSKRRENWSFRLKSRSVSVTTSRNERGYTAFLDQGKPLHLGEFPKMRLTELVAALNLGLSDLSARFAPEVVSTGLRYLIVPIERGLDRARIVHRDFGALLAKAGAQFAYILDVNALEGRHWNNDGLLEDVATGSAAGTVGAFLVKHGVVTINQEFILRQGRFTGRPSEIRVRVSGADSSVTNVLVGGEVAMMGHGILDVLPEDLL